MQARPQPDAGCEGPALTGNQIIDDHSCAPLMGMRAGLGIRHTGFLCQRSNHRANILRGGHPEVEKNGNRIEDGASGRRQWKKAVIRTPIPRDGCRLEKKLAVCLLNGDNQEFPQLSCGFGRSHLTCSFHFMFLLLPTTAASVAVGNDWQERPC